MLRDVPRGIRELTEDQHLPVRELLRLQEPSELLKLVILLRRELAGLLEEADDLVEVEEGLVQDLIDLVLVPGQSIDLVEELLRDDVFVESSCLVAFKLEGQLRRVTEDVGVLKSPTFEPLLLSDRSRCGLRQKRGVS